MSEIIVSSDRPIALVGGGVVSHADLTEIAPQIDAWVGVDSGAAALWSWGQMPDAVIGDLDSLPADLQALFADRLHHLADQDSTDFDKALRSSASPLVLGVGFSGGRMDHTLAAFHVLVRRPERRCILLDQDNVVFHCPAELRLDLPVGADIGLFPMGKCMMESQGLVWPTAGLTFTPAGQIGTSNKTNQKRQILRPDRSGMLVIVPRQFLPNAIAALSNKAG